jgi:hypothetical protein
MKYLPILATLFLALSISAQTCDHTSDSVKRFDAMRILPPVKIRAFNGLSIEATYQDNKSINAVSFDISKDTAMPGDFSKTFNQGLWWIVYDSCDGKFVYVITPVLKEQFVKR